MFVGIAPSQVAATLRELVADDDPVVVDETITHSRIVQRHLLRTSPDSYFYVQGGLGQGIAVALGVELAAPRRPVILTVGDGAFLYNPVIPSPGASRIPRYLELLNSGAANAAPDIRLVSNTPAVAVLDSATTVPVSPPTDSSVSPSSPECPT